MSYDWFSVFGIELEYMVVDQETLDVRPIADLILQDLSGVTGAMEVTLGPVAWSNELARHVLETKTNGPTASLVEASAAFSTAVEDMNRSLAAHGGRLLPSGMHPWMNPERDFQLWPTDEEGIYGTFHRIFDCRGHGWSNLQSMHINLPFTGDAQFRILHSAIRFLLPILPALSASSPYWEGRRAPNVDQRLSVYRTNAHKVPQVSGWVIPEPVTSRADYEEQILEPIYRALTPLDPEGTLHYEWVNARGAIARFDRMAIEIRVLDVQECPRMDLAIASLVTDTLRWMCHQPTFQRVDSSWSAERLAATLWRCVASGSEAILDDADYLSLWQYPGKHCTARELWQFLAQVASAGAKPSNPMHDDVSWLLLNGTLAERLLRAAGDSPSKERLREVYTRLSDCLAKGDRFVP